MSKHLTTVGKKNSFLRKKTPQQNLAQGGAAISPRVVYYIYIYIAYIFLLCIVVYNNLFFCIKIKHFNRFNVRSASLLL